MKQQYVFTEEEYRVLKSSIESAYHYAIPLLNNNDNNIHLEYVNMVGDLRYALDILEGYINSEDNT